MNVQRLNRHKLNKITKEQLHKKYISAFNKKIEDVHMTDGLHTDDRLKLLFLCVKVLISTPKKFTENELDYYESLINVALLFMGNLTIKQFKTMYPITKSYNGQKYGFKDYYSVIEDLSEYDENDTVNIDIENILWSYDNEDICKFMVKRMCLLSERMKRSGELGLAERFARDNGIPTYKENENGELIQVWYKPNLKLIEKGE